ncbi:Pseudopilin GspJ [Rubripirellula amarantea]|uniref:Pseudopilin GspJ n=1 Tax=Rubripirellula amarantea TaxID=2527999 RepID=A0A5C5WPU9_9BACT|nr:prepilin-type cleavage/methylation domain-containing protein [Rubripirellula amarantea]TWT52460.1 Pseudopilin GspJ [Rubripirellula amarantea]
MRRRFNFSPLAFTLLEVVLTLAMSVVLMVLVGGAIQFYGRDMVIRDMDVRQTQLAASLIQMIEDDLRATMHSEPADMEPLETLLAATAGQSSQGGEEDLSAAGIESEDDAMITTEVSSSGLETSTSVLETPGLIGSQFQIQVDLSRLPRLEEYTQMLDPNAGNLDDVPSDLKTVAYFVQSAGAIAGVQDPLNDLSVEGEAIKTDGSGGLVRRSLDRAATVYAANNGSLSLLSASGDLLAPEVTSIEFQYWDGITWLQSWSSDEYGELPMAVKVQLTMSDVLSTDENATRVFSHVVRLPMARPVEEEEDEELSEAGL